mmetsp:Transcript_45409/g.84339  ORF Transcript_45409/g.84339 Transcript_45409/m.84339 type:complete len:699 (-) Transcript_45409:391-2487(-)
MRWTWLSSVAVSFITSALACLKETSKHSKNAPSCASSNTPSRDEAFAAASAVVVPSWRRRRWGSSEGERSRWSRWRWVGEGDAKSGSGGGKTGGTDDGRRWLTPREAAEEEEEATAPLLPVAAAPDMSRPRRLSLPPPPLLLTCVGVERWLLPTLLPGRGSDSGEAFECLASRSCFTTGPLSWAWSAHCRTSVRGLSGRRRRERQLPSSSPSSLSLSPSSSGASSTARKINSQFNDDSDSDESGGETSHPRLALSPSSFKSKNKKNKRRQQWLGGGGGGSENEDEDEDEEGGGADGTRLGQEPEGDEFEGEEELEEDDDEDPTQPQVKWAWDLANYLPESVVEYFHIAVSKFLIKPWEKRRDLRQDRSRRLALLQQTHHLQLSQQQQGQHLLSPGAGGDTALASQVTFSPSALLSPGSPSPNKRHHDDLTPLTPGGGSSSSSSSSQANAASVSGLSAKVDETDSETLERFVSVLVSKSLAHTLLQAVEEISEHCSKGGSRAVAKTFPLRAGSFRKDLANPSLEFVKCVCRVLSLDASVAEEVQRLRRTLLTQCGVREFAPESTFTDLGLCLVLPDVICECCNHHRDLDLCRDPSVTMEAVSERWRCQACESVYDKDAIELRLVDMIQRRSTRYQLQDLRCSKCLKVATRQLGLHCPCSGKLVCDEGPEAFAADLRVMKRVAIFHGFEWLREVVRNLSR